MFRAIPHQSTELLEQNKTLKILMLEDNPDDAEFVKREFIRKKLSFILIHKENKKDYIDYINYYEPDLIISDYRLPTITGLDALIIARGVYPNIPFIIVTSSMNEEVAVECLKSGADDYILKDNLSRLVPAITSAVKNKILKKEKDKAINDLIESEERFRTLADNMFPLSWMADPDGNIFWFNKRWYDYTGTNLKEMYGWGWTKVHHPDHVDRVVLKIKEAFSKGIIWEDVFPLLGKDGNYRWFISRAVPIFHSNGKIIRWFGTDSDITEIKNLQDELQRSNKELEQFAYVASHDLQEPIRMIKNYAHLFELKNQELLKNGTREYLSFITEGATRMQELVTDLLKYSRVTTAAPEHEPVNLNNIVKDVLDNLKLKITEENASIHVSDLPVVKGSRTQLRQLFQNFIENALKFRSERNPEIKIQAVGESDHWRFSIQDNGMGIDNRFLDRIFVIFQRLHERGKYQGSGVGLALCKKILEKHGGRVFVESEIGKGSTFHFTLPA